MIVILFFDVVSFCGLSAKASAGSLASCFNNRFHFHFFVFSKFAMVLVSAGSLRRLLRALLFRVLIIAFILFFCVFEIRNGFSFCGLSAEASAGSLPSCLENCLDHGCV